MDEDQNYFYEYYDYVFYGYFVLVFFQLEFGKVIDFVCGMQVMIKFDVCYCDYGGDIFYFVLFVELVWWCVGGGLKLFLLVFGYQFVVDESYVFWFG